MWLFVSDVMNVWSYVQIQNVVNIITQLKKTSQNVENLTKTFVIKERLIKPEPIECKQALISSLYAVYMYSRNAWDVV